MFRSHPKKYLDNIMTNLEKILEPPKKRRLASEMGCKKDLENELPKLFEAFKMAFTDYEREVVQTPPSARARGFEASLLNSKMINSVQTVFPREWKFGKYKRFTLRVNGYIVLFKKLNSKDKPMNIKTNSVSAISNQLSMSLFDESTFTTEPILFFGYRKDRLGQITDPKLVYIDENKVQWTITEDEVKSNIKFINEEMEQTGLAMPKLKVVNEEKKASNN